MVVKRFRCGRASGALLVAGCVLLTASCVSNSDVNTGATATDVADATAPQPRYTTYACGEGGTLTVENLRTSVLVIDPEGDSLELPASPATQQARYGQAANALVLDGDEALYMKGGQEPLNCSR